MPGVSASVGIGGGFLPGGLTNGGVGGGAPTGKYNVLQNGGTTDPTADNAGALTLLATSIPAGGGTIYFPAGLYRLQSSVTLPSRVAVELAPGALFAIDAGATLGLNGALSAPVAQIFSGAGNVAFGRGRVEQFFPQWWGALADGAHDDTAAVQAAATACVAAGGGVVYFAAGNYRIVGTVTVDNHVGGGTVPIWFRGAGAYLGKLVKPTAGVGDVLVWNCTDQPSGILDMGIIGDVNGAPGCKGLTTTTSMNGVFVERVWFAALGVGCHCWGNDIFVAHCISELNTEGFRFEGQVTAHALDTYKCNTGYRIIWRGAASDPQPSCILNNCRDTDAVLVGLQVQFTNYVQVIGWTQQSSVAGPPVSIQLDTANKVQVVGATITGCQNGVQLLNACRDFSIRGGIISSIGMAGAGGGTGIVLSSATQYVEIDGVTIDLCNRSGINTGAAQQVRIRGVTVRSFGRGNFAGDNYGVLLLGDAANKGTDLADSYFEVNPADPQIAVSFGTAPQVGTFVLRRIVSVNGTTFDFTNAPAATTTIVSNRGENEWNGPPVGQRHLQGEILWNTQPVEAGVAGSKYVITGWVCTATGTPGTWLPIRALTGN